MLHKFLVRVASNYGRLVCTLVLGLLLVPLLLNIGTKTYGVVVLLGASFGIGRVFQDIMQFSLVSELGAAYHQSNDTFQDTFSAANYLCLYIAGILTLLTLLLSYFLTTIFNIPSELESAALCFAIASGYQVILVAICAAFFNMYLVQERFISWNLWLILRRAVYPISALIAYWVAEGSESDALVAYSIVTSVLFTLTIIIPVILLLPGLEVRIFCLAKGNKASFRRLLNVGGWNFVGQFSAASPPVIGAFLMNYFWGVAGNAMFAIALQLAGYIRMVATGLSEGLDAVSARTLATNKGEEREKLVWLATKLPAIVAFPVSALFYIFIDNILFLWLGERLHAESMDISILTWLFYFLGLVCLAQTLVDGQIKVLYGAGEVRGYALGLLFSALIYTLLTIVLFGYVPQEQAIYSPAIAWAITSLLFSFVAIPAIIANWVGCSIVQALQPLFGPLALSLILLPPAVYGNEQLSISPLWQSIILGSIYLICYFGGCIYWFVPKTLRKALLTKGHSWLHNHFK
jgi:Na+-driven multidrug efflux pump